MVKYNLNFAPFISESYAAFFSFKDEQRELLSHLPETLIRMEGSLYFANILRNGSDGGLGIMAGSYLRASLAEYVSIEEMVKVENKDANFSLLKTECPLPHILKLLRHFQTHIGTIQVSEKNMHILYQGDIYNLGKWVVTDIKKSSLLSLRRSMQLEKISHTTAMRWLKRCCYG